MHDKLKLVLDVNRQKDSAVGPIVHQVVATLVVLPRISIGCLFIVVLIYPPFPKVFPCSGSSPGS